MVTRVGTVLRTKMAANQTVENKLFFTPFACQPGREAYDEFEENLRKELREQEVIDKHVRGVAGVGSTRKAGQRRADLKGSPATPGDAFSPRSHMKFDQSLSAVSGVLSASPGSVLQGGAGGFDGAGDGQPARVSTVEYNDKMAFIFDLFATHWPLQGGAAQQQPQY